MLQSVQSVPEVHTANSLPIPPSSQSPSLANEHVLLHRPTVPVLVSADGSAAGGDGGGDGDGGKRYQQNEPIGMVKLMNGAGLKLTSLDDPTDTEPKTGRFAWMYNLYAATILTNMSKPRRVS